MGNILGSDTSLMDVKHVEHPAYKFVRCRNLCTVTHGHEQVPAVRYQGQNFQPAISMEKEVVATTCQGNTGHHPAMLSASMYVHFNSSTFLWAFASAASLYANESKANRFEKTHFYDVSDVESAKLSSNIICLYCGILDSLQWHPSWGGRAGCR